MVEIIIKTMRGYLALGYQPSANEFSALLDTLEESNKALKEATTKVACLEKRVATLSARAYDDSNERRLEFFLG